MFTLIWQVAWPRSTVPIWPESTYACAARFRTHKTFAFNGLHVPHVFLLLFFYRRTLFTFGCRRWSKVYDLAAI